MTRRRKFGWPELLVLALAACLASGYGRGCLPWSPK